MATSFYSLANFAKTTLAASLAAGVTTVSLASGTGSLFPDPSITEDFFLTVWNRDDFEYAEDDPYVEIFLCTGRVADTLTIVRGQQGTSDNNHNISGRTYAVALTVNKGVLEQVQTAVNARGELTGGNTWSGVQIFEDKIAIGEDDAMTINGSATTALFSVHVDDGAATQNVEIHRHSTNATGSIFYGAKSRGTGASPTVVADNDSLLSIYAVGYDGTDYATAGAIHCYVDDTPGSNDMPGRWEFQVSPNGSQTLATALTIGNDKSSTFTGFVALTGDHTIGTASAIGYVQHSTASGLVLQGHGVSNDMTFVNSAGNNVFRIVTGTTTVRFYGIVEPTTNDVATLGSGSRAWSDAFFADGAVLNFNNGNYTMTHSSSLLTFSNGISSIYATIRNTATATLTTVTQGLTLAGNLVTSTYVADGFTPGLVWSSTDDNASKPKAGIFSKTTGSGSYVIIGTSSSYATGIVSTVSVGPAGEFDCGTITSVANSMLITPSSGNALLEIGNSTLTGTIAGVDFHFGVTGAQDFNVRLSNYADQSLAVTASSGVALFGITGKLEVYNTSDAQTMNIDALSTTQDVINVTNNSLTTGSIFTGYSNSSSTGTRTLLVIYDAHASAVNTTNASFTRFATGTLASLDASSVNGAGALYGITMNLTNAGAGLEYAFRFNGSEIVGAAVGGTQDKKVRVSIAGTDYFIPLHTT